MSNYAIFFDYDNTTYRLPTNPEQIEISTTQAIEKYEVLKLGQIAVPTHLELVVYSFECEFPYSHRSYIETPSDFKDSDFYISLFTQWRNALTPVRFIASNDVSNDINTLVLIEELTITEKAGEEGDKYISFKLVEYKQFGKKLVVVNTNKVATSVSKAKTTKTVNTVMVNPKSNKTYVVKTGECLWDIAKTMYGDGSKYTKIYAANKNLIKNPGLIYPGQKLVIPI